jgi:outer membrane protein assembly factor BamB
VSAAWTTRCCSATALILSIATLFSIAVGAQHAPGTEPLPLFPVRAVWTLTLNNALIAPPAYSRSHVYFAIEGDRLVAYEWEHGRQTWIVSARPVLEPVEGDGLLFVPEAGALKALRIGDGSTAWTLSDLAELAVPPIWHHGWLILCLSSGEVMTLLAADGGLAWRRDLGSPAHATPAVADDRAYVPLADGRIVALDIGKGATLWEGRLPEPATALLATDDRLFGGSRDNFFYAIREEDGTIAWRWRTGADVVGLPVVDDRNVYFVSMDNVLRALSRRSGVQQWVRPLALRPTRGPLMVGRTLIVSGIAQALPAFNMSDGRPAGDLPATGELAGAPAAPWANDPTATGLPRVLVVTRDLAKGAIATLLTRQLDPPLSPFAPPPGAIAVNPPLGAPAE